MDKNSLSFLEKNTHHLSELRQTTAQDLLRLGLECLNEALVDSSLDPELLADACENFLDSIRHNRSNPEPYIAMGYLLWLAAEYEDAMLYLSEAIILDPQNADARKLVQLNKQALEQSKQVQPLIVEVQPDAMDLLYDQLDAAITQQVKELSSRKPDWFKVTDDRFELKRMEQQFHSLTRQHTQLMADLAIVAEEIDCQELETKMNPLNLFLRRATKLLTMSKQRVELKEKLNAHIGWLELELKRSKEQLSEQFSREHFDALLDDCDYIADQLDELDETEGDVSALISSYEMMISQIERIQNLLDTNNMQEETIA